MAVTYSILYQDRSSQGKDINSVQISYAAEAYTGLGLPVDMAKVGCPNNIDSLVVYDSKGYHAAYSLSAAVTFTAATDVVNLTGHGLSNGDRVVFSSIATTTAIVPNVQYYVVSSAANTFKVAASSGGSAIDLDLDGTGVLVTAPKIRLYQQDGTTGALAEVSGNQTVAVKVIATGW